MAVCSPDEAAMTRKSALCWPAGTTAGLHNAAAAGAANQMLVKSTHIQQAARAPSSRHNEFALHGHHKPAQRFRPHTCGYLGGAGGYTFTTRSK